MLSVLASLLLTAGGGMVGDQKFGSWQSTETCASGFDSFGCTRTLSQLNPNLDVILIFRDSLAIRAKVKSCDQKVVRFSFTPDPNEWKRLTPAGRMDQTKRVLMQWGQASAIGCDHPSTFSFDRFEDGFSRLDAVASSG